MESIASRMILFIQKLIIIPTIIPSKGPPKATLIKLPKTPTAVDYPPLANCIKSMKNTIAVPSFIKDSPSTRVLNLTLAPNSFNKATTATGSVALKTHPRVKASYHES